MTPIKQKFKIDEQKNNVIVYATGKNINGKKGTHSKGEPINCNKKLADYFVENKIAVEKLEDLK